MSLVLVTRALAAALTLLLLPLPAAAQPSDDRLIVPGARIGTITLALSVDTAVRMLGEPAAWAEGLPRMMVRTQPGILMLDWTGPRGLGLATKDERAILVLYSCSTPQFATARGVKYGEGRAAVESAYGRPTMTTQPYPWRTAYLYDPLGLAVLHYNWMVDCIAVFRPRTARQIWRL
jgi:hypothetical protein